MEDTLGTQAQSESSYVAKQYPGAFNKEMELGLQLRNVPIPSEAKPDINGFREGDRVCLTRPFSGDGQHYAVGVTGTIFLPDTSPAHIRVGRMANLLYVLLDSGNPVQMSGDALQKIPGRFEVIYSDDRESVSVVPH